MQDIGELTNSGYVPHQIDDVTNNRLCVYPKNLLNKIRDQWFRGIKVRAYYLNRQKLDDEGYLVFWENPSTPILIGPGDCPMMNIPVGCLSDAVLES